MEVSRVDAEEVEHDLALLHYGAWLDRLHDFLAEEAELEGRDQDVRAATAKVQEVALTVATVVVPWLFLSADGIRVKRALGDHQVLKDFVDVNRIRGIEKQGSLAAGKLHDSSYSCVRISSVHGDQQLPEEEQVLAAQVGCPPRMLVLGSHDLVFCLLALIGQVMTLVLSLLKELLVLDHLFAQVQLLVRKDKVH